MEKIKTLKSSKKNTDIKESFKIGEKNKPLTNLFENKTGEKNLEKYPQEIDYYLTSEEEITTKLKKESSEIEVGLESLSGSELEEGLLRKNYLESRIKKMEKYKKKSNALTRYLSYITNNERL